MHFTKLLKQELESHPGVLVSMTRQHDITMSKYERLSQIMHTKPDLVLSIHADAHHRREASGFGVFLLNKQAASSHRTLEILNQFHRNHPPSDQRMNQSRQLGQHILDRLKPHFHLHDEKPKHAPLVVLRSPEVPSILIELGFVSNTQEIKKLTDLGYLGQLSSHVSLSILSYWQKQWHQLLKSG